MYQMFFIIIFKRICEAVAIYITMVMDGYDRNLTTFHLCLTKVFATHPYLHKIMAYHPFYERPSHHQLVNPAAPCAYSKAALCLEH